MHSEANWTLYESGILNNKDLTEVEKKTKLIDIIQIIDEYFPPDASETNETTKQHQMST